MNIIKFSKNWNNKLNQTIFTTIRKYNYKKWVYYKSLEDAKFKVFLEGQVARMATLINVEYLSLNEVPKGLICADTGCEFKEALKIFRKFGIDKHETVIILTFKKE